MTARVSLAIGWLYPAYLSTYGDRGNIICLQRRAEWRNIETRIVRVQFDTKNTILDSCDILLGGGAQDRQQGLVLGDLKKRRDVLLGMFDRGVSGLFVCGSPQLLGHWYMTGDGIRLEGLGIFDYVTKHFGTSVQRCIGNTVGLVSEKFRVSGVAFRQTIVGFENHGGRTYLGKNAKPFARVLVGSGNNGEDQTDGAIYRNVLATYSHGPFLPKNPHIADWLISRALAVKYGKEIQLQPLDDTLEWQAHEFMLRKLKVPVRFSPPRSSEIFDANAHESRKAKKRATQTKRV